MIHLKSEKELELIKESGRMLKYAVDALIPTIEVGMSTKEIDDRAQQLLHEAGAELSFNKVPGYHWATCLPVNEQAVHTPPSSYRLKSGDLLTVDIGAYYEGFHTDYATSLVVGEAKNEKILHFLDTGKRAVDEAIKKAVCGGYLGEISKCLYDIISKEGYFVMKDLTGHGVGRELHEDPLIPGFLDRPVEQTYRLQHGLTVAVEVIYSMGSEKIRYDKRDGWSISSSDSSLTACFEKSIAITDESTFILT